MKNDLGDLVRRIALSRPVIILSGCGILFVLFAADCYVSYEISLSIFYLCPILWILFLTGDRIGTLVFCLLSAIAWLIADISSGLTHSHPLIPLWNMSVRMVFFVIISMLLLKQKKLLAKEQERSRRDALTNVGNLRYFYESSEHETDRALRYGRSMTFVYFDVDDFKQVNDRFGHLQGDRLLRTIASTVNRTIRKTDILARMGGDEFVLLMPEVSFEQANVAIERLRVALLDVLKKEQRLVTLSFGMATFHKPLASVEEMVRIADELMYKSKKAGKNKVTAAVYQ